jgi:hypothetical protein
MLTKIWNKAPTAIVHRLMFTKMWSKDVGRTLALVALFVRPNVACAK